MRVFGITLIMFLLFNCASTQLTKQWKNPEYPNFVPKNVLVIGVTPDLEVRKAFEFQFIKKLNAREVNALQSSVVFDKSFQNSKNTEVEIEAKLEKLMATGYDAILISVVKGVENNVSYSGKSSKLDYRLRKFIGYYLAYQDTFFNEQNYDRYDVFTIETSLYSFTEGSDISKIWSGTYDMVDLNNIKKSITDYVNAIIKTLEKEGLIKKI